MITFEKIKEAYGILKYVIKHTPLERSKTFSEMTKSNVYLKLENFQNTGSFKIRGAYNKIHYLTKDERDRGVVCSSAGNHAQGVAYASKLLGVKSTIFMPIHTPPTKILATKSYGAEVILKGETYDDAYKEAKKLEEDKGMTFVHAFNDDMVIAGQGTIGIEIHEDLPDADVVLVPIGGGGLVSGISTALKNLNPKIKIIGVEAEGANAMKISLEKNSLAPVKSVNTIADGIAVKSPGEKTFEIIKKNVDKVITVNDKEIANALYMLLQRAKIVAEPAGAVTLAALLSRKISYPGKNIVALISGGNINLSILTQLIERGMLENELLTKLSLIIPDKPKSFKDVLSMLSKLNINISSVSHDRCTTKVPLGYVKLDTALQTIDKEQVETVRKKLEELGIEYEILK